MTYTMKLPENVRAYFQSQGRIGAEKRKEMLSPERRTEIARMAAAARWAKKPVGKKIVATKKAKKGMK